jgi:hypothetical protein
MTLMPKWCDDVVWVLVYFDVNEIVACLRCEFVPWCFVHFLRGDFN